MVRRESSEDGFFSGGEIARGGERDQKKKAGTTEGERPRRGTIMEGVLQEKAKHQAGIRDLRKLEGQGRNFLEGVGEPVRRGIGGEDVSERKMGITT